MSQPEQTLEWTYYNRLRSGFVMMCIYQHVHGIIFVTPVILLLVLFIPHEIGFIFGIILLFCCVLLALCALLFCERPSRTLRVNRHIFTLTTTNVFGTKESQMNASGAMFRAVHLDFFERLFTFDFYRIVTAYHIELSRSGESFLFPCVNETEQRQILAKIKEFGIGDNH